MNGVEITKQMVNLLKLLINTWVIFLPFCIRKLMNLTSETVISEQLGHLGLIASVINELGIVEKIDRRLPVNHAKGAIVNHGRRVAAMLLNGLGFMNSRLYLTTHFYQDKPVANLLGEEITAEQLNDDCLGRCLDEIAKYGVTQLFSELAFEIASDKELLGQSLHLDTTSFELYGRYEDVSGTPMPTYGHSKANRPDLKQVILSLTTGGVANLPLWMESLDGNSSDRKSFHETVKRVKSFMETLEKAPDNLCFIVDAAFYDAKKLSKLDNVRWITRVPALLTSAKEYLYQPKDSLTWTKIDKHYQATSKDMTVSGVAQRWVMFFSEHAYERESKTLQKRIDSTYEALKKQLWHLSNQVFSCEADAVSEIKTITKKLKYHTLDYKIAPVEKYTTKGRPNPNTPKVTVGYKITTTIETCSKKVQQCKERLGRFILATNQLDAHQLTDSDILKQYKEQSQVESGFKFIKDNAFELDSFYLKTPRRIEALMMIMTLCLMVYNFAQYHIRKCLQDNNDVLPNQLGKPTKKPTIKWLSELMVVIAVVTIDENGNKHRIITNVNQVHRKIIGYFGKSALKRYGLPPDYQQVDINYSNYKNLLNWCEK